ncbi:MAG: phosphoheptose isomerase [Flavobacteriales bacterium]|nr:phosphoheptose isomerase [Flavobacteriales bacterium]|tara:strand:- start:5989 stop:6570 length:582 start_codon:yes stop_codon:yes gene_type:complete
MADSIVRANFLEAKRVLESFLSEDENIQKIEAAGNLLCQAFEKGSKVISCGNGGSMCDAMHFAEELTGRFRENRKPLAAVSISDPSHLSCVANDYGYDEVFSRYIQALGNAGDVLLAISTSGNSKNVLKGIEAARENGMKVIGLTGKDGGAIGPLCDIEIRAPQSDYADRAQEIHIKVIHSLIHYVEERVKSD